MGVRELGVQEKPKVRVLLDLVVSQHYDVAVASSDECPRYNRQNNGVNRLAHIFYDD